MKKTFAVVLSVALLLAMIGLGYGISVRSQLTHYVVLTFDDGRLEFSNDQTVAIMDKFGFKGVAFAAVHWTGTRNPVWSHIISEGWEIGSHSWNHVSVNALSAAQLTHEIVDSKKWLENAFGVKIISFAYPNSRGETNQTVRQALASAGHLYARGDNWNEVTSTELPRWTGVHSFAVTSYPVTDHEPYLGYKSQMAKILHDATMYGIAVAMFHGVDASLSSWGAVTPSEFTWCLQQIQNAGLQAVTFQQWNQIEYGASPSSQITISITLQPFNMTMQLTLTSGTVWTAPQKMTVWQKTWTFKTWNDGSSNPTKTFVNNGNYQVTYT